MKHSSLYKVLDTIAILLLLPFSAFVIFATLLIDTGTQWSPLIGVLLNAGAIAAILFLLSSYAQIGRVLSIALLVLGWLLGLMVVVFGFAPGVFLSALPIAAMKSVMFLYPPLFLYGVLQPSIGKPLFKIATVLFIAGIGVFVTWVLWIWVTGVEAPEGLLLFTIAILIALLVYLGYRLVPSKKGA